MNPSKKTQTNTVISGSVRAFRAKYFPQVPGKTDETRVPQGVSNSNRGVSLEEFSHSITGKFLGSSFCVYHTPTHTCGKSAGKGGFLILAKTHFRGQPASETPLYWSESVLMAIEGAHVLGCNFGTFAPFSRSNGLIRMLQTDNSGRRAGSFRRVQFGSKIAAVLHEIETGNLQMASLPGG